jgi:Ca2+-binding RTX toxin-like protein
MKTKRLPLALGLALTASALATAEARAATISSPFGSAPVSAVIGMASSGGSTLPRVMWQNNNTGACSSTALGSSGAGLDDNYLIVGGSGDDTMLIVGGVLNNIGFCGFSVSSLAYNGHFLDISGSGGSDVLYSGTGDTWSSGNDGNDFIYGYTPIGLLLGGAGQDAVLGSSAIATDSLFGDSGDDCLKDPGNAHSSFDCGTQDVHDYYWSGNTPGPTCEVAVSGC